jgi:hypothetical protein
MRLRASDNPPPALITIKTKLAMLMQNQALSEMRTIKDGTLPIDEPLALQNPDSVQSGVRAAGG